MILYRNFYFFCYNAIMERFYFKDTFSYKLFLSLRDCIFVFLETLGDMTKMLLSVLKRIVKFDVDLKELTYQCSRFGVSSLPITLSIVGMSSIIVATQVAGEMVKQGGGNYVGMFVTLLLVREQAIIMSGFAIIYMIGSSLASEIATMKVTDQIDAIQVLKVDPIKYLIVPRILSGLLMMPLLCVISTVFGILGGAFASNLASGLSYRAYFDSVWFGLYTRDMYIGLFKAAVFGFVIALISCSCGYRAKGGAKGVGEATTNAVVWSFIALVFLDMIFAIGFFF